MADLVLAFKPQTNISLFWIELVQNPLPYKVSCFPPTKDEVIAVKVGFELHDLVKVVGVTVWYPVYKEWTKILNLPFGKYPPVGTIL